MTLLSVFAAIALVLAMAGIYGTVAYAVAQRTQEIGIRVALGAATSEVLRLVLWDALKPVVAGLALGVVAAFALSTGWCMASVRPTPRRLSPCRFSSGWSQ